MRFFLILTLALGFQVVGTTAADARRGASGYSEGLEFVAPTGATTQDGAALSLCVLVRTDHLMFIDIWRTQKGYGVAENACNVDNFFPIDAAELAELQADGLVDAAIPSEPAVKAGLAVPVWAWLVLAGLVGFALMKVRAKMARKSQRQQLMGDMSPAAMAIIDAMCHVAKADGDVSMAEVREIAIAVEQMTGETIDPTQVGEMAKLAEDTLSDKDFKKFAAGRSEDEKEVMMRGVLYVAVADGKLDGKEQAFVGKLAKAMQMPGNKVTALLQEVVASRAGAPS